ncbi:MAG: TetR/AcrR family transcriptional regulator [Synergistaceae bacterium]|nr:TetR/AcrR family transcriptional regulator [Synergistaceae bacterium]
MRQERISDDKKSLLMDSAIKEFSERGFENASYNKIIERSGLSKGTVYYYFENKESLLKMVLNEIIEQFMSISDGLELPETKEEFWEVDCEYNRRAMNFIFENPHSGLLYILFSDDQRIHSEISDIFEQILCFRHKLIGRGQSLGVVRSDMSVETMSMIVQAIGKVLSASMIKDRGDKSKVQNDVRNFVETMCDLSVRIFTPPNK